MKRIAAIVLAGALAACGAPPSSSKTDELAARVRVLEDERAVMRVADALDEAVDAKDWERARSLFTDQVEADFTSLDAENAGQVSADELVANWRRNLHPGKTSQRSRSGEVVVINGDEATMTSQGHVRYEIPARADMNVWEGWGRFEHRFTRTPQGWRISGFKFTLTRQAGEASVRLEALAPEPTSIVREAKE
ncbi:MAG: nuclear transport factor 2 family protein [Hydrogenophilaceae bacterium]|jgi:ketosteroid isomerase-like protein|nr:nuclear transport factor 2 family protein [Hydrogenophilaceae bacterium]